MKSIVDARFEDIDLLSAKGPLLPKSIMLYSILAVQLSHRAYSALMPSIQPLTVSLTEIELTGMPFMAALAVPLACAPGQRECSGRRRRNRHNRER